MKRFIKMYYSLLECNETTLAQKLVLSLIISYHEGGKEFYMTNKAIAKQLKHEVKYNTINKVIPKLEELEFITCNTIRYESDVNGWVNKRIISLTQKTLDIINSEVNSSTETPVTLVAEQEPVIEHETTQLLDEEYDELDETLTIIGIEPFEDVNEIEEPIEKLEGEQEVDDAIEKLKVVYVDDDVFKEKIPYIKMCSYDGDGYCLKRFEKRVTENKGKFVKRKRPSVVS